MSYDVHIVGGGLARSEAAGQLANAGLKVRLSEMRGGGDMTPAHETDRLAEMVCSNSFRSDDAENNAVGLLHRGQADALLQVVEEGGTGAGDAAGGPDAAQHVGVARGVHIRALEPA